MANPKHVEVVLQGAVAIREWRAKHPAKTLHLRGADLAGADLSGATLTGADLSDANLHHADLHHADLHHADLSRANLTGANLSGVDLNGAVLSGVTVDSADLSGANLNGAVLSRAVLNSAVLRRAALNGANLTGANLTGADLSGASLNRCILRSATLTSASFTGARFADTTLVDCDLMEAFGLAEVRHEGPSDLGTRSLVRSKGRIPPEFLRGCGLDDWEVEAVKLYDPSLSDKDRVDVLYEIDRLRGSNPIRFDSCFISYSHSNKEFAKRLHHDLQEAGVRCWLDDEDLRIGDKLRTTIDVAIESHKKLLLILSEPAIASAWVENEVEKALEEEKRRKDSVLFPVRIDDMILDEEEVRHGWARTLRSRHIGDFTKAELYESSFERLLRDLRAKPGEHS